MPQAIRHQLWIAATAAIVFFTNLGATHLWEEDEPWYAATAREMRDRGDWVVPCFNGQLSPEKPPLVFWMMIGAFRWFGDTEFAARFWSALLGIGTSLLTYHLGRLLFRAEVGFWAGLIMTSTVIFTVSARAATMDSTLVFLTTLSLLILVLGSKRAGRATSPLSACERGIGGEGAGNSNICPIGFLPGSWLSFVLLYAVIGLAVLAKGPVALVLPVAVMVLFVAIVNRRTHAPRVDPGRRTGPGRGAEAGGTTDVPSGGRDPFASVSPAARWRRWLSAVAAVLAPGNVWRAAWQLRPLTAIIVVAAVALPWYVMVGIRTDGAWLAQFLGQHNLARAFRPMQGHSGPFIYYIPAILVGFFPWSVFLVRGCLEFVRRLRAGAEPSVTFRGAKDDNAWHSGRVLLACWMGVWVVFFSVVSTKLPHYVLPMYPALALMTAVYLDRWLADPAGVARWHITGAAITLALVGAGMVAAALFLTPIFLPGEGVLGLVGLILVAGGGGCLWLARRQQDRRMLAVFAATSVAFVTALFGFAALRVDRHQIAPPLLAEIRQSQPAPTQLAAYLFFKRSFVWYAGEPVPFLRRIDQVREFLATAQNPCLITTCERIAELEQEFPGVFQVIGRERRFLQRGEVLALTCRRRPAAAETADRATTDAPRRQ